MAAAGVVPVMSFVLERRVHADAAAQIATGGPAGGQTLPGRGRRSLDSPREAQTPTTDRDGPAGPVLVVDFGAQYAQLIARRVREANVYSEIVPHTWTVEQILAHRPAAVILSGGPASVYAEGAPAVDRALFERRRPVLGICYGFQAMARALGGTVARTGTREYGGTHVSSRARRGSCSPARPPSSRCG